MPHVRSRGGSDVGAIVFGWLTKLAIVLGVLGVLGFDGISLVHTRLTAADAANTAASAAAENYKSNKDIQQAYNAALATLGASDASIETTTFKIATDGSVTLRLHLRATTLVISRIAPLRSLGDAVETGTGTPSF